MTNIEINNEEKKVIQEIRALTGLNEKQISSVFLSLSFTYGMGNYFNGEKIVIPYFGEFKLKFEGDEVDENTGKRKANVTGFFSLNEGIKKNIGIVEDFLKTGDEKLLLDLSSYKVLKDQIRQELKQQSED